MQNNQHLREEVISFERELACLQDDLIECEKNHLKAKKERKQLLINMNDINLFESEVSMCFMKRCQERQRALKARADCERSLRQYIRTKKRLKKLMKLSKIKKHYRKNIKKNKYKKNKENDNNTNNFDNDDESSDSDINWEDLEDTDDELDEIQQEEEIIKNYFNGPEIASSSSSSSSKSSTTYTRTTSSGWIELGTAEERIDAVEAIKESTARETRQIQREKRATELVSYCRKALERCEKLIENRMAKLLILRHNSRVARESSKKQKDKAIEYREQLKNESIVFKDKMHKQSRRIREVVQREMDVIMAERREEVMTLEEEVLETRRRYQMMVTEYQTKIEKLEHSVNTIRKKKKKIVKKRKKELIYFTRELNQLIEQVKLVDIYPIR